VDSTPKLLWHDIESMRVQRALDVLDAGGFIVPDSGD
jgi:hypothetical protein